MAKPRPPRFRRILTASLTPEARQDFKSMQELIERSTAAGETRKAYAVTARQLAHWLCKRCERVGDLTPERVREFLGTKSPGAPRRRAQSALRLILRELLKDGTIDRRHAWEQLEWRCLARLSLPQKKALLERAKARRGDRLSGARDYAFLSLLLVVPTSPGELRQLRIQDCTCRQGEPIGIHLPTGPGPEPRSHSLEGVGEFAAAARKALRQWLALRDRIRRYRDQQRFFERTDAWAQSPYLFPNSNGGPLSQRIDYRMTDCIRRQRARPEPVRTAVTDAQTFPTETLQKWEESPVIKDLPADFREAEPWDETETADRQPTGPNKRATAGAVTDIYQFRIQLLEMPHAVWRELQVRADTPLADLSRAIQIAFGWEGYHLHRFQLNGSECGNGDTMESDRAIALDSLHLQPDDAMLYEYDFGDCWQHEVRLQEILPMEPRTRYPRCTNGHGAAPPEDCGGPPGYYHNRNELRSEMSRFNRPAINETLAELRRPPPTTPPFTI